MTLTELAIHEIARKLPRFDPQWSAEIQASYLKYVDTIMGYAIQAIAPQGGTSNKTTCAVFAPGQNQREAAVTIVD